MSWSASHYLKFEAERERPIRDLLAAIPTRAVAIATDLGCGPGTSAASLAEKFPSGQIEGIDSSPDMICAASERCPHLRFTLQDISTWSPGMPQDIILANASLQWVPDHQVLLPRLARHLAQAGTLAIQMPDNLGECSHTQMRATAAQGPWADRLAQAASARTEILGRDAIYGLLRPICTRIDIWRTTYNLALSSHAAIADIYGSTGLASLSRPAFRAGAPGFRRVLQRRSGHALPGFSGWHRPSSLPAPVHHRHHPSPVGRAKIVGAN
jgi:trans-aconitate 2-methyltransferase